MNMSIQHSRISWEKPQLTYSMETRREEAEVPLRTGEKRHIEIIERAVKALISPPIELKYTIHEKTGQIQIKLINAESKEVVREIPSEKLLDISASICELAGLFIDEKL